MITDSIIDTRRCGLIKVHQAHERHQSAALATTDPTTTLPPSAGNAPPYR
jgi:hypothetical protein